MKNFAIPGLYKHYKLNILLLDLFKKHPEYFIDDLNINAIYGTFPFCSWDGGRIFFAEQEHAKTEQIESLQHIYNDIYQVPMRFIFTNKLITKKDLNDKFNNLVMEICQNSLNEVVINSELLKNYIKKQYPKYSIISSTTKCITNPKDIFKELNNPDYKYVCLDYNINKNYKILEEIPEQLKPKVELLINSICGAGCPNRENHYTLNSLYQLNYGKPYQLLNCSIKKEKNLYPYDNNSVIISPKEIEDYYYPHNFSNYKIEGRTFTTKFMLLNLVKYLIKDKYQFYVLSLLLENIETINKGDL